MGSSSSSGICNDNFGRWPVIWPDPVEPGVVVAIGGGDEDIGMELLWFRGCEDW